MEAKPYSIEEIERADWGTLQGPRLRATVQALAERDKWQRACNDERRVSEGLVKERDALKADLATARAQVEEAKKDAAKTEAWLIERIDAELKREGLPALSWTDGGGSACPTGWRRNPYLNSGIVDALRAKLAEADKLVLKQGVLLAEGNAAAREEQREADVRACNGDHWLITKGNAVTAGQLIRSTPLTSTPLADEIAKLTTESAKLRGYLNLANANTERRGQIIDSLRAALETAREALVRSGRALKAILDLTVGVPDMRIPAIALDIGDEITAALAAIDAVKEGKS